MVTIPALALPLNVADKPTGSPVGVPIPVAPEVLIVINGLKAVFTHNVELLGTVAVLRGVIIMVRAAIVAH